MTTVRAQAQAHDFAVRGETGAVNDEVHLRALLVALPEADGIVDEIDARAALGDFVGANHFIELHADFRARVDHREASNASIFFQAAPVAFVGEGFAAGDAHGGENAPSANEAGLTGRKADFLDGEQALVVEDERVNHSCASVSGTKRLL